MLVISAKVVVAGVAMTVLAACSPADPFSGLDGQRVESPYLLNEIEGSETRGEETLSDIILEVADASGIPLGSLFRPSLVFSPEDVLQAETACPSYTAALLIVTDSTTEASLFAGSGEVLGQREYREIVSRDGERGFVQILVFPEPLTGRISIELSSPDVSEWAYMPFCSQVEPDTIAARVSGEDLYVDGTLSGELSGTVVFSLIGEDEIRFLPFSGEAPVKVFIGVAEEEISSLRVEVRSPFNINYIMY